MTDIFCVKCKRKTENGKVKHVMTKNNRAMDKTTCRDCGITKCKFVSLKK